MSKFKIQQQVGASAMHVYNTMLGLNDKETYEKWTAAFSPTSIYEGSWNKGERIYFVGTDGSVSICFGIYIHYNHFE